MFSPSFYIVPKKIYQDKNLQPLDSKVWGFIYWYVHLKEGRCFASNRTLATQIQCSEVAIRKCLDRLEKCGYIKRFYKDTEKKNRIEIKPMIQLDGVDGTPVSSLDDTGVSHIYNNIEKNNYTASNTGVAGFINSIIDLFKDVNPSFERLFANKTQRSACGRMLKKYGFEKVKGMVQVLSRTNTLKYAPTITTPCQLEDKLGQLISFVNKEKGKTKVHFS